ncbi:hypothetical protein DKX38_011108 [Salix brachista]|uniref:Uncharacterized protein n=1 Tax=Salix brachista TaxID=2182728 RepID=A0A5N5LYG3_9ROSI|nr:hypothetical protein DKX38_011108 [Salix brachista]
MTRLSLFASTISQVLVFSHQFQLRAILSGQHLLHLGIENLQIRGSKGGLGHGKSSNLIRSYAAFRVGGLGFRFALDVANGLHYHHNFTDPTHL